MLTAHPVYAWPSLHLRACAIPYVPALALALPLALRGPLINEHQEYRETSQNDYRFQMGLALWSALALPTLYYGLAYRLPAARWLDAVAQAVRCWLCGRYPCAVGLVGAGLPGLSGAAWSVYLWRELARYPISLNRSASIKSNKRAFIIAGFCRAYQY